MKYSYCGTEISQHVKEATSLENEDNEAQKKKHDAASVHFKKKLRTDIECRLIVPR